MEVVEGDPFNSSPTDPKLMGPDALARFRAGEKLPGVTAKTPLVRPAGVAGETLRFGWGLKRPVCSAASPSMCRGGAGDGTFSWGRQGRAARETACSADSMLPLGALAWTATDHNQPRAQQGLLFTGWCPAGDTTDPVTSSVLLLLTHPHLAAGTGPDASSSSSCCCCCCQVELPLGATEDRICGTIDIEKALTEGVKAFEPGLLVRHQRAA
jgi:hypothetical protein